ncbi:hypothetical protein RhiirC2_774050 [Rhizophagus irregularis]|uniref:F-box domain-containing protein n=1 Tax=Rhizophagus irregularis TaxID=588596 RepID=A0A2N1NMI5_9GLOM|nr:hypothetical protein RhiirC2_774050 [Rhizophagus irregularis]
MSYSKIFLDLPELVYDIIKYFKNDFSTLHSCILVNRLWCRLAIPLLWENPFLIPNENYNFIGIYLHNLSDDLKAQLNEYKIDDKLFPSNTLFNYPIYLKYLYIEKIISSIEEWSKDVELENRSIFEFKRLIHMSLFKIFIENEVNIHTFDIEVNFSYIDDMLELILQNPNFLHNIRNLKFNCYDDLLNHTKNLTYQIINLCQNLKKISLAFNNSFLIYQTSLLSKDYNHSSNTLNTIVLYNINFKIITNLDNIFEQLNVLKSVHIIYCILGTDFIQQIINSTKPFKLKSLFLNSNELQIDESLLLLIQKHGDYLENFGFSSGPNLLSEEQQLLELIIKYCKNIKFLYLTAIINNIQIIYSLLNLTENVKQNLNHLYINIFSNNNYSNTTELSSIVLQNLGQLLPLKLEYLSLVLNIKYKNDFEMFLKNSQNTFIKKLLIKNKRIKDDEEGRDIYDFILSYIKEYIMKKKRVKYLAIINFPSKIELFSFKDEVKEFELYNIKIQKYRDLCMFSKLKFIEQL